MGPAPLAASSTGCSGPLPDHVPVPFDASVTVADPLAPLATTSASGPLDEDLALRAFLRFAGGGARRINLVQAMCALQASGIACPAEVLRPLTDDCRVHDKEDGKGSATELDQVRFSGDCIVLMFYLRLLSKGHGR